MASRFFSLNRGFCCHWPKQIGSGGTGVRTINATVRAPPGSVTRPYRSKTARKEYPRASRRTIIDRWNGFAIRAASVLTGRSTEDAFLVGRGVLPSDGCDCTADGAERMAWRGRIGSRVGWPVGVRLGTLAEKAKEPPRPEETATRSARGSCALCR